MKGGATSVCPTCDTIHSYLRAPVIQSSYFDGEFVRAVPSLEVFIHLLLHYSQLIRDRLFPEL